MTRLNILDAIVGGTAALGAAMPAEVSRAESADASPFYGVTVPGGYWNWRLAGPAFEAMSLDEQRAIVGSDVAINAYRAETLPFPDGSVLVKLAWKRVASPEFAPAPVPGAPTTIQVMVKYSDRYTATDGFRRFVDGKPVDAAQHETCSACHGARVKRHDFVFTRYAS